MSKKSEKSEINIQKNWKKNQKCRKSRNNSK